MQWFGGKESDNVEEGSSSGGGRSFAVGGGVVGVIGLVIYLFTGINPAALLNSGQRGNNVQQEQVNTHVAHGRTPQEKLAMKVFKGTEDVWDSLFTARGKTYQKPILHFFTGSVDAGCGFIGKTILYPFLFVGDRYITGIIGCQHNSGKRLNSNCKIGQDSTCTTA